MFYLLFLFFIYQLYFNPQQIVFEILLFIGLQMVLLIVLLIDTIFVYLNSNSMKSINQFDYPSKQAQSYKVFEKDPKGVNKEKHSSNKLRYKQNLQYHKQLERNKVQQAEKTKKQEENRKKKQQLESELEKKKKQLLNLEVLKQQAEENQRKAFQLALLKQQQDRIKKQQDQKRKQQFDNDALIRFGEALNKMHQEKQTLLFKEKLAEQRRKTTQDFQRIERAKAIKYKAFLQEKQKNTAEQQDLGVEVYQKTLKTFMSHPNPDYNKTCLHNLKVVPQKDHEEGDAFERGRTTSNSLKQKSEEKRQKSQMEDRKSQERGRKALLQMQRDKQYQEYQNKTAEEQRKYNLERIEAGKKNQFTGLKPTTLQQMEKNKKLRSEEEFNRMFFPRPVLATQITNREVPKHEIYEQRIEKKTSKKEDLVKKQAQENQYFYNQKGRMKNDASISESKMQCLSQGKYSFEQPEQSSFQKERKTQSNFKDQDQVSENEEQFNENYRMNTKNSLKQTRIPEYNDKTTQNYYKNKGPTHQNQSPSLSQKNKQIQQTNYQVPQEQKVKIPNPKYQKIINPNQQSETFNTEEMLKKYGIAPEFNQESKHTQKYQQPKSTEKNQQPKSTEKNQQPKSTEKNQQPKSNHQSKKNKQNDDLTQYKSLQGKDKLNQNNKEGKEQSNRRVVQLSNICQNKKNQKQQLSYSSESEEDSLM